MRNLVIIGAGDFGREMANVVERINEKESHTVWNLLGFIDDDESIQGTIIDDVKVIGNCEWLNQQKDELYAICSLGVAETRKKVINKISNLKIKWATLIDPDARIYKDGEVGEGSIVCGGSIVHIHNRIGKHVVVNINCTFGHDAIVKDYCVINPGVNVSGKTVIEECVDLGTGAKVLQGLTIGANTRLGAGGVAINDLPANCTAVGVPAKPVKFNERA